MKTIKGDHQQSSLPEKIAPGLHRSRKEISRVGASKADARYWLQGGRLVLHDSANYSIQIYKQGQRCWFPLGTPNKKSAAAKAAEIYSFIQAQGWASALERFKPKGTAEKEDTVTVGKFISTATSISSARQQSLDAYAKAFRRLVSEISGIDNGGKFDSRGGGTKNWRARVDGIVLQSITPAEVVEWKNRRLRAAEGDPLAKRRAIVTVNSLLRCSKALFGKKILPFIEERLPLPRPLPFDGVLMEKPPSMRYVSRIDALAILAKAKEELQESDPDSFRVIILALVCGLRRSEIDHLLWRAFDFPGSKLRVEASEYHELKSEDSAGVIDLDADTLALFREGHARSDGSLFVIDSAKRKRLNTTATGKSGHHKQKKSRGYRCDPVFKKVLTWLRAQGVDSTRPLHTMRKEIGSIIASEHGIFEASRYLRHSDIRITSAIYADRKKAITPTSFAAVLRKDS